MVTERNKKSRAEKFIKMGLRRALDDGTRRASRYNFPTRGQLIRHIRPDYGRLKATTLRRVRVSFPENPANSNYFPIIRLKNRRFGSRSG